MSRDQVLPVIFVDGKQPRPFHRYPVVEFPLPYG